MSVSPITVLVARGGPSSPAEHHAMRVAEPSEGRVLALREGSRLRGGSMSSAHESHNGRSGVRSRLRERVALRLAPWLYVPYREDREEAFRDLAEVAYGSRDAVWTSPRVLAQTAMQESRRQGRAASRA